MKRQGENVRASKRKCPGNAENPGQNVVPRGFCPQNGHFPGG